MGSGIELLFIKEIHIKFLAKLFNPFHSRIFHCLFHRELWFFESWNDLPSLLLKPSHEFPAAHPQGKAVFSRHRLLICEGRKVSKTRLITGRLLCVLLQFVEYTGMFGLKPVHVIGLRSPLVIESILINSFLKKRSCCFPHFLNILLTAWFSLYL